MPHNTFNPLDSFDLGNGKRGQFYSLPKLEAAGIGPVSKLPVSIRIVIESVLRNVDGRKITERDVRNLANWACTGEREEEIPFMDARVLLQDFTGVPLLVDLAACGSAGAGFDKAPRILEPLVPVDLVVDHSVQVDFSNRPDALQLNMEMEFKRNQQRYQFLKWGMQAFNGFQVVPPGIGIVHQVNLEYLARGVLERDGVFYPDTLVGTDSHTTMINGLGIVGWGVGGIEAEAGMLGQPVYFLTPDVIGVHLSGALKEGVTATDLVLTSVAGPKRPQDRIELEAIKQQFINMLQGEPPNGYGKPAGEIERKLRTVIGIKKEEARDEGTVTGGGEQAMETMPHPDEVANTSVTTEEEMMDNRPTPDRVPVAEMAAA